MATKPTKTATKTSSSKVTKQTTGSKTTKPTSFKGSQNETRVEKQWQGKK
jgi:hypothetical protein